MIVLIMLVMLVMVAMLVGVARGFLPMTMSVIVGMGVAASDENDRHAEGQCSCT